MSEAVSDFLREMIRDQWGMTMREIVRRTGWPKRVIRHAITSLESQQLITHEGGRYVAR